MESFGAPTLEDVQINSDGTMKNTGKQNVKFYPVTRLAYRARRNQDGSLAMNPKTGLPHKDAYEETVEFVRIETKGDTNIIDQPANDFHKRQFLRQYTAFFKNTALTGTPIESADFLQSPTILELHMLGVHTIEQIADMDDLICAQIKDQSGFEVREIAQQWVKITSPQGRTVEITNLNVRIADLQRQLDEAKSGKARFTSSVLPEVSLPVVEETPIATMELTPEQLNKGRPRKV